MNMAVYGKVACLLIPFTTRFAPPFTTDKLTNPQPVAFFGIKIVKTEAFWKTKSLDQLNPQEWEQLCDGCGRCCLVKLEDEDTGAIYTTSVSCSLFDINTCRCTDYDNRFEKVSDCIDLSPGKVDELSWLPQSCAYRLRHEGKPLADWHPLNSKTAQSVIDAGISIAGQTISEAEVEEERLGDYLQEWPVSEEV